jgi:hypothetical protein
MQVFLSPRERAVYPHYFGEQPMRQEDIARMFGVTKSAICHRIRKIRAAFAKAGIPLFGPGEGLTVVRARSLSGVWDGREYLPASDAA